MVIIYQNPNRSERILAAVMKSNTFCAGSGNTIEEAYQNALIDPEPFPLIHICETEADFHNLRHTHPELFL